MITLPAELARIARFGSVGIVVTATYAALAWTLTVVAEWPAVAASLTGWASSAVMSYFGHRIVTFRSSGRHSTEGARFAVLAAFAVSLVILMPAVLTDHLGFHPAIAIGIVCVAVPAVSYVVMLRLIFADRAREPWGQG